LAEHPGSDQRVTSGGGVGGAQRTGPDHGPRGVFVHESRR
jgi:hypothetical protein